MRQLRFFAASAALATLFCLSPVDASAQGKIIIVNADTTGEGFNDQTPAAPIGGNSGTTVGSQRLIAFQYAASIWETVLNSPVDIHIRARFDPLSCTADSGTLGQAGTTSLFSDFANAPRANTWYPAALANKLSGIDLAPASNRSDGAEISAQFNSNLGQTGCLETSGWYLGLDGKHGNLIDLAAVLLHEFGHGFGFASYVDESNGSLINGKVDIFSANLLDLTTGLTWDQMTARGRKASAINTRKLVWNGSGANAAATTALAFGVPSVLITSPTAAAFDAGEAEFGAALTTRGESGPIVQALDGTGTATDACEAITNASAIRRKIALVDRGTCTFVQKALNVQAAGASAMIVVDNTTTTPADSLGAAEGAENVKIPSVRVTLADGNTIKSQLASGVSGTVGLDGSRRAGVDAATGKALLYSPNPVDPGSSVSHWDTIARPNQLMEPFISDDLTHTVTLPADLTYELLKDIGWN
jgi:hypothetical protein